MAPAAESIFIGVDNSIWMAGEGYANFKAQLDAIKFYCKAKFEANPETVVGLFTMGSYVPRNLLFPPTSDLDEILDLLPCISPGCGELEFVATLVPSISMMDLCSPAKLKRMLLFVGGPTKLNPSVVNVFANKIKDMGIAVDVVNFFLEKSCKHMMLGYRCERSELDALVVAANVNDNSHIVHVEPRSSIKDVLSKLELFCKEKKTLKKKYQKNIVKENADVKASLELFCKEKNHAAADDDFAEAPVVEYGKTCLTEKI